MKGKITNPAELRKKRKLTSKMIDADKEFLGIRGKLLKELIINKRNKKKTK